METAIRPRPDSQIPGAAAPGTGRAWIELNLENLAHNVRQLSDAMGTESQLMAVVKAEAYGHGGREINACLQRCGVRAYAVATVDEGVQLRREGITGEILILGYTDPARAWELERFDLIQTLISYDYALALSGRGRAVRAHLKIDTGMHRLGFDHADTAQVLDAFSLPNLRVEGIFTHLCDADRLTAESVQFTRGQLLRFDVLLQKLHDAGIPRLKIHMQSSYGLLNYPGLHSDYVRVGIVLYGASSAPDCETRLQLDLRPVLSLRARVVLIRSVPKGEYVGYGRTFQAPRDTKIAVLPIGYADGVPRNLSGGKGSVLLCGQKAPIVGRICMDQLTVDVTDIPGVQTGMAATLIGRDGGEEITAAQMADSAGTISNELLSRLGRV